MRNFFVALGKAACYVLLFLGVQVIVTSAYLYYLLMRQLLASGAVLTMPDMNTIDRMLTELSSQAVAQQNLIYLITAILTIGFLVLFFRLRRKRLLREVWAMPIKPASLWPVVLLGVTFPLLICYALVYIPWPESAMQAYEEAYGITSDQTILAIVTTVLAAPILEEIIFRGLVFTRLCGGMPAMAAAILASTVFAMLHGTFIWAAYAFVGGMMMLFVYTQYRSLYASMLFHMLFNLVGGYLVNFIPDLGVGFDIAMILVSAAASAALCFVILRMPWEKIDKYPTA